MQIILGGAYNGKRKYVIEQLKDVDQAQIFLFEGILPTNLSYTKEQFVIIAHFEKLIETLLHLEEEQIADELYTQILKLNQVTNVICICTDMSRGVVPLDTKQRQLRDTTGRLYQKLCSESERIVRVWYGIPHLLKGE